MIVIGASLGGIVAVQTVLAALPRAFALPVTVVLHRQKEQEDALAAILQESSSLPVAEPFDKEPIEPGRVYLAPAGYHLLIEPGHFCLSMDVPVRFARPSIDVLFESAADAYRAAVIAVVLTGANQDGAEGAERIHRLGGRVIIQDSDTAECPVMPAAALKAVPAAQVVPLGDIGALLARLAAPQSRPTL